MLDCFSESSGLSFVRKFIEFGWESKNPLATALNVTITNDKSLRLAYREVAKKFDTYVIYCETFMENYSPLTNRKIHNAIKMKYHGALVFITYHNHDKQKLCQSDCSFVALWPNLRGGLKNFFLTKNDYDRNGIGNILESKLNALNIAGKNINLRELDELLFGNFNTDVVTEKFYNEFKNEQVKISSSIVTFNGVRLDEKEQRSYSVLLLNRLIFIYFFQKKGFLNSDQNYLRTCLKKVSEVNGKDDFFNFYKKILIPLFFNLNNGTSMELEKWQQEIIGEIPYVNGGLFEETVIEKNIDFIPDSVFEDVFTLFDGYDWYLDNESSVNGSKTINPDVLGHIFEKYINYEADGKKENGAYYTSKDIAYYMINNTLSKKVLSILSLIADKEKVDQLLAEDPARYLNSTNKLSMDLSEVSNFIECQTELLWSFGDQDSNEKYVNLRKSFYSTDYENIDFDLIANRKDIVNCLLPGENMVEALRRHEKTEEYLKGRVYKNLTCDQDTITVYNIDIIRLNIDLINLLDVDELKLAYEEINKISVIDPTCGSGSFLLAAMDILEEYYNTLLGNLNFLDPGFVNKKINNYPNMKYFIRKEIALKNIYGTDLMGDAIETAKLRLFLSLVSTIDSPSQIRPLPDLDFNLKEGNLIVGVTSFKMFENIIKNRGASLFDDQIIDPIKLEIERYIDFYKNFQELNINNAEKIMLNEKKKELEDLIINLRDKINEFYGNEFSLGSKKNAKLVLESLSAFHWIIEFPQIFATKNNPGFDVIIGNPPYIKMKEIKKIYDGAKWKLFRDFKTIVCPDFYAVCYENSLNLLNNKGYHSFIVMHNLTFGDKYKPLREEILKSGVSFWSTYGLRPSQLFKNAIVRNAIVTLERSNEVRSYGTQHNLFNAQYRSVLFENLDFYQFTNFKYMKSGVFSQYIGKFTSEISSHDVQKTELYCRNTFSYWYPVLPSHPYVLNDNFTIKGIDNNSKTISGIPDDIKKQVTFLLGGRFGYLFWGVLGDDYNNLPKLVEPFVNFLSLNTELISENIKIKNSELREIYNNFTSTNLHSGVITTNIKWTAGNVLPKTAVVDLSLISLVLGEENTPDAWRKLNIWFYRAKKSSKTDVETLLDSEIVKKQKLWVIDTK